MPTLLPVQDVSALGGAQPVVVLAAADGVEWTAGMTTFLWVANLDTASKSYEVTSRAESEFGTYPNYGSDVVRTVAASSITLTVAFDPRRFADPQTGLALCTFSGVTNLYVAALRMDTVLKGT